MLITFKHIIAKKYSISVITSAVTAAVFKEKKNL